MGLINIIIIAFVILILVITFVNYPSLSMKFFSAAGESVGVVLDKGMDMIGGWISNWNKGAKENGGGR